MTAIIIILAILTCWIWIPATIIIAATVVNLILVVLSIGVELIGFAIGLVMLIIGALQAMIMSVLRLPALFVSYVVTRKDTEQ